MTPSPGSTALLGRAAVMAALGVGAVTVLAGGIQPALVLSEAFPARVALIATAVLIVAVAGLRGHHPFGRVGPANLVTGIRALLVALLAAVALEPTGAVGWWVVLTAAIAASLDLADGWLARRTGLASAFGARFDMEVDALLILVLSTLVWRHGLTGPWVLASGLMRYAFVAAALVLPWMNLALPPSRRRQAVCVVQIAALIMALAPITPPPAALALAAGSLALLTWSFWVDVAWLARVRVAGVVTQTAKSEPPRRS